LVSSVQLVEPTGDLEDLVTSHREVGLQCHNGLLLWAKLRLRRHGGVALEFPQ
jgi:hypothetical protein